MIDIDKIEALAKAAADHGENIGEENWYAEAEFICNMLMHPIDANFAEACAPATILALIAEVRALREDAERYRWLRDKANSMGHVKRAPLVLMTRDDCSNNGWEDVLIGEGLDKAIDAARGAV